MAIKVIRDLITTEDLKNIAKEQFGDLVKAVIDVKQEVMAVGGELHADEEVLLVEKYGSKREDIWGINLYPEKVGSEDFVEFDSVINLKPSFGNRSRGIEDPETRKRIRDAVKKLVSQ